MSQTTVSALLVLAAALTLMYLLYQYNERKAAADKTERFGGGVATALQPAPPSAIVASASKAPYAQAHDPQDGVNGTFNGVEHAAYAPAESVGADAPVAARSVVASEASGVAESVDAPSAPPSEASSRSSARRRVRFSDDAGAASIPEDDASTQEAIAVARQTSEPARSAIRKAAAAAATATNSKPADCYPKDRLTPEDLLPEDAANSKWAQVKPAGQGSFGDVNLLNAGFHVGINTVGSSMKNPSFDLRSEPPNPRANVSPWMQSSWEPDLNRRPLEIG